MAQKCLTGSRLFAIICFVSYLERCPSGLRSWSWKPVMRQAPWVRISPSPPSPVFAAEARDYSLIGFIFDLEKYSRGRRGAPAKGVGRVTGARVQISLSPPRRSKLCIACSDFFSKVRAHLRRCSFSFIKVKLDSPVRLYTPYGGRSTFCDLPHRNLDNLFPHPQMRINSIIFYF